MTLEDKKEHRRIVRALKLKIIDLTLQRIEFDKEILKTRHDLLQLAFDKEAEDEI